MNCYIHALPGRLRIRTDFLKKNELGAFSVQKSIHALQGVRNVVINTLTGSILVTFDSLQISAQTLLNTMAQQRLVPVLDYEQNITATKQRTRVWVETKEMADYDLWPFLFKKVAQVFLASLEVQPSGYNILVNIVLPSLVDAM